MVWSSACRFNRRDDPALIRSSAVPCSRGTIDYLRSDPSPVRVRTRKVRTMSR